jgi:hypothetical protein
MILAAAVALTGCVNLGEADPYLLNAKLMLPDGPTPGTTVSCIAFGRTCLLPGMTLRVWQINSRGYWNAAVPVMAGFDWRLPNPAALRADYDALQQRDLVFLNSLSGYIPRSLLRSYDGA